MERMKVPHNPRFDYIYIPLGPDNGWVVIDNLRNEAPLVYDFHQFAYLTISSSHS